MSFTAALATAYNKSPSLFDGLPHAAAIVSVEEGGQLLPVLQAPGLNGIREAQGPEGQRPHGLLHQLNMTSSPCGIGLEQGRKKTLPS